MGELVAQSLAFGNLAEELVAIGEDLGQEFPKPHGRCGSRGSRGGGCGHEDTPPFGRIVSPGTYFVNVYFCLLLFIIFSTSRTRGGTRDRGARPQSCPRPGKASSAA